MKNYAGVKDCDEGIRKELEEAGIKVYNFEYLRTKGEVPTSVMGVLEPWSFHRAWYYWIAEGPGIPLKEAEELYEKFGKVVRVGGSAGSPSPKEFYKGFGVGCYHVDTQEGLNALADTIRKILKENLEDGNQ